MPHRSILFLSHFFGPNPGNFIRSLLALEEHLLRSTTDGSLQIVYAFPEQCRSFAWCQNMLAEKRRLCFYQNGTTADELRFLEEVVRRENVILIHTHFEALGRAIYRFRLRHPKIPVFWHKHNDFSLGKPLAPDTWKQRIKETLRDMLVVTVAVSPHLKTPRGYVLLNHLDTRSIPYICDAERNAFRKSCGLSENDFMILMFGWNKPVKGVDIGCRMLEHLPDPIRQRCKLCIVMEDSRENRLYVEEHCAFPGQVLLLKNTDQVFLYHRSADIMLSAARSEAFAYTIFEALAVETPVVTSDIPGVQWSRPYPNVRFFPTEDPKACARAICDTLANADPCLNRSNAAQIREDFAISKWCARLLELYRKHGVQI